MCQSAFDLGGAIEVIVTIMLHLIGIFNQPGITIRAEFNEMYFKSCCWPFVSSNFGDFRDDLAALFNPYMVTDMQVQFGNLVCIVQRRTLNQRT